MILLRWIRNLADLLEKRPFSVWTVLSFALFVGFGRAMLEHMTGADVLDTVLSRVFEYCAWYWQAFFAFALVLRLTLRGGNWRQQSNVILVGLFLGLFPPIIDVFIYGVGNFGYQYVFDFREGWRWYIYHPEQGFKLGETITLWLTLTFTTVYVAIRSRSVIRSLSAAALAYLVILYLAGGPAQMAAYLANSQGWANSHLSVLMLTMLAVGGVLAYSVCRPGLLLQLLPRLVHATPFVMVFLLGSQLGGGHWL
jgi:hypothetical protein